MVGISTISVFNNLPAGKDLTTVGSIVTTFTDVRISTTSLFNDLPVGNSKITKLSMAGPEASTVRDNTSSNNILPEDIVIKGSSLLGIIYCRNSSFTL